MSDKQCEASVCDNNPFPWQELEASNADRSTDSDHIAEQSDVEYIFQPGDNAIDNNVYDECADSLQEQVSSESELSIVEDEEEALRRTQRERDLKSEQRRCALQELVDTERTYIHDLEKVVDGYMRVIRTGVIGVPSDLKRGKWKFVFGNIEDILKFHREHFLPRLEKCLEDPGQLGRVFTQCERQMKMYVGYHRNKPYSEHVVSQYDDAFFAGVQQQLGHTLTLSDYLIKPVQRPMMYKLLLSSILKLSKKVGITEGIEDLESAVKLMQILPQTSNDMLEIGPIQGLEGGLSPHEKLLRKGPLLVLNMRPESPGAASNRIRFKQRTVFLFEQIIVFCVKHGGKKTFSKATFHCKRSLPLNKTKLFYEGMEPLQFLLTTKSELEEGETLVLQAPSEKDRQDWINSIEGVLKTQELLVIALGSPIAYHEGLACETPSPRISENPLPPHVMLRLASVKQKSRKKSSSLSVSVPERNDETSCAEQNQVDPTGVSLPDSPFARRKTFFQDPINIFRSLKRKLKDKEHTHI